jgi:hypothetical protein
MTGWDVPARFASSDWVNPCLRLTALMIAPGSTLPVYRIVYIEPPRRKELLADADRTRPKAASAGEKGIRDLTNTKDRAIEGSDEL